MRKGLLTALLIQLLGLLSAQEMTIPCPEFEVQTEYDSIHRRYHFYEVKTKIGNVDSLGLTAREVFALICSDLNCVAPMSKGMEGPLILCEEVFVKVGPSLRNPVVTAVDTLNLRLTNYSLPGHFLHRGKVERQVVQEDGVIWIITQNEGHGRMPRTNERKAESTWKKVDDLVIILVGQQGR